MKEKVEEFIGKKIDKEIYPGCQVLIGHQGDVGFALYSRISLSTGD